MNDAGFRLREWNSNSHCLKDLVNANGNFSKDGNIAKILGLKWDPINQSITFIVHNTNTLQYLNIL